MTLLQSAEVSQAGASVTIGPPAEQAPAPETSPGLQRTAVRAGTLGFVLTTIAVTVAVVAFGGGIGSIGAGIMVGSFDGFPFGAMLGVMTYYMRHPENP